MNEKIWEILLTSAKGAFIEVTVFVGAVLLLFSYLDYKRQESFIKTIARSKKYQPLLGSLLGIMPGCGGSILIMPLYVKGSVTFGAVVATLIATAGDSAFILLTRSPRVFMIITPICFIVGAVTGYIVDYYQVGEWIKKRTVKKKDVNLKIKHKKAEALLGEIYGESSLCCRSCSLRHLGHEEGDEIDMVLHHATPLNPHRPGYKITHGCSYIIFWAVVAVGLIFAVMDLMQIDINQLPGLPNAGFIIGGLGTLVTILYIICSKKFLQAQTHEDEEHKLFSFREALIHNAQETAFVGTWVFVAFFVYELGVFFAGGEQIVLAMMVSTGLTAVLLGVLLGIIPGCGPQILFVSLYLKGMFPFAALLANAISQDGDALFPLIAMDRKSAFWATAVNTFVALIVGIVAYFIEIS